MQCVRGVEIIFAFFRTVENLQWGGVLLDK